MSPQPGIGPGSLDGRAAALAAPLAAAAATAVAPAPRRPALRPTAPWRIPAGGRRSKALPPRAGRGPDEPVTGDVPLRSGCRRRPGAATTAADHRRADQRHDALRPLREVYPRRCPAARDDRRSGIAAEGRGVAGRPWPRYRSDSARHRSGETSRPAFPAGRCGCLPPNATPTAARSAAASQPATTDAPAGSSGAAALGLWSRSVVALRPGGPAYLCGRAPAIPSPSGRQSRPGQKCVDRPARSARSLIKSKTRLPEVWRCLWPT